MRKLFLPVLVLLMIVPAAFLTGGTLKGVTLPDTIDVEGQKLVLNGMALRKKFIFKVYVAGLYLAQKETDYRKVFEADQHRRTVMHFVRSVSPKKINNAWFEGLEANTPNASAELKKQFKDLAAMMEKVKDGEAMMFTYIPGKGTVVEVKGKEKGVIPGKAFADALFACWIGEEPGPGEDFRDGLMGKSE